MSGSGADSLVGDRPAPVGGSYRPSTRPGRDGFGALLHAEWTKFRTVRGWVVGMVLAGVVTVLIGLVGPLGSHMECVGRGAAAGADPCAGQRPPLGPDGEGVLDNFTFVHRTLTGDGQLTARITDLTGRYPVDPGSADSPLADGLQPWSKGGLILKDGLKQGSQYAAVLATGTHGVRMQSNFTKDTAGPPGAVSPAAPRWLRLARAGDTVTGYVSVDGTTWRRIDQVRLPGLPAEVEIGLFSGSPEYDKMTTGFGGTTGSGAPSFATATFDQVALQGRMGGGDGADGAGATGTWTGSQIADGGMIQSGPTGRGPALGFEQSADGRFTVTGSGDIAPVPTERDNRAKTVSSTLIGTFAGLIAVVVIGAMFMTSEYRRGLIRTTLAASPRRGRVLAAKCLVLGGVAFVVGLLSAGVAVPLVGAVEHSKGMYVVHTPTATVVRVVLGTALLLAVAAVFAVAVGCVVRRSAAAVAVVVVGLVLPYFLAVASMLPAGVAEWLTRVTPAAAFALQQSAVEYPQVAASYAPADGYFPLGPWTGFAVLCAFAAAAVSAAYWLLRERDA